MVLRDERKAPAPTTKQKTYTWGSRVLLILSMYVFDDPLISRFQMKWRISKDITSRIRKPNQLTTLRFTFRGSSRRCAYILQRIPAECCKKLKKIKMWDVNRLENGLCQWCCSSSRDASKSLCDALLETRRYLIQSTHFILKPTKDEY